MARGNMELILKSRVLIVTAQENKGVMIVVAQVINKPKPTKLP